MEELFKTHKNGQWELLEKGSDSEGHITKHPDGGYVHVFDGGASRMNRKQATTAIQDGKKWTMMDKLSPAHQEHVKNLK